jgi:dTDP-4-dehydrorhamnose reductase
MISRVVVIGKSGQLARALFERAAAHKDFDLVFLGRPDIDLANPEALTAAVSALRPGALVNCAAYTKVDRAEDEPELAFRNNADVPRMLAAWAAQSHTPFVHISTDYVFDGKAPDAYAESHTPNPINIYGKSKLAGENAIRESGADALILRTSWLYSAHGTNFVTTMLHLAEGQREVHVVSDQIGSPTAAPDVAEAIFMALTARMKETSFGTHLAHFAGRGSASWYDVAREVFAVSERLGGPHASVEAIASADYPTKASRPKNSRLDSRLFEARFHFKAPEWKESIGSVVERILAVCD